MDEITFQEHIATLDMLASNKEFDEILEKSISREDQIALRQAFKLCKKSGKQESFILRDCELLCCLGKIAHRLKWFEEAETFFRHAVAIREQFPDGWYNFGLLRLSQGKEHLAEEMFNNALACAPLNWEKRVKVSGLLGHSTPPRKEGVAKASLLEPSPKKPPAAYRVPVPNVKSQISSLKTIEKTGKCAVCGKLVGSIAYVCRYCGREHCQDHRIPENHGCGPGFRPLKKREMPTTNEELIKEIARIGELAANKAYIDISIKTLTDFDEKVLKHAFSAVNAPDTKAEVISDDFELWFRAGKVAQRLSWPHIAEKFYRIALVFGTEVDAWKNLGKVCEAQGKIPEAEDAYRKVTVLDPENAEAWLRLGDLYEQEGRYEEGKIAHQTSFKRDPQKARDYVGNRRWHYQRLDREEVYQNRVKDNETDAEAWFALGTIHFIRLEFHDAEQAFRTGLRYDSKNSVMWNTLGCVLLKQHQIDRGEKCYRQAIEIDPDNWEAHYNLGLIYEDNDRTDAAIKEFEISSEIVPGEVSTWIHLCVLLKKRGRIEESKNAYRRIESLASWIIPFLPDFEGLSHIKFYKDPSALYT